MNICRVCFKRINFITDELLRTKKLAANMLFCDGVISVCEYGGIIKEALIRYKFFNKASYYRTFAELLSKKIKNMTVSPNFDIITSVPLHRKKENLRGYNQSELIASIVSRQTGIYREEGLILRINNTKSQSLLGRAERQANVLGAFRIAKPEKVRGKNILLIDDIFTTGSTINECCRVLKASGANAVFGAVIASRQESF